MSIRFSPSSVRTMLSMIEAWIKPLLTVKLVLDENEFVEIIAQSINWESKRIILQQFQQQSAGNLDKSDPMIDRAYEWNLPFSPHWTNHST